MATTPNTGVTLLEQSQAQKEITINEALMRIDTLLGGGAIDKDLATPPGSPAAGDVYIVAASATGAWSGKSGKVAYYDQGWKFIDPKEGMLLWLKDEDQLYYYSGSSWTVLTTGGGGAADTRVCDGRLTLTSGTPVTTSDVTGAGSVYFTPYKGNQIALFDGTSTWTTLSFSQLTISLASGFSAGKLYDVFAYNNAGAVALETLVWTNDTTRATALTLQNGVYVKAVRRRGATSAAFTPAQRRRRKIPGPSAMSGIISIGSCVSSNVRKRRAVGRIRPAHTGRPMQTVPTSWISSWEWRRM